MYLLSNHSLTWGWPSHLRSVAWTGTPAVSFPIVSSTAARRSVLLQCLLLGRTAVSLLPVSIARNMSHEREKASYRRHLSARQSTLN